VSSRRRVPGDGRIAGFEPGRIRCGPRSAPTRWSATSTLCRLPILSRSPSRRIVALRPVRIAFDVAGDRVEETHETLLLLRAKITSFESASDEAVGHSNALELLVRRDPQAKDLTGGASLA
jgi:hypothetical protein